MDNAARQVRRAGQVIDLKMKEYALLEFLLRNAYRAVTRTMIVEHVWDIHFDSVSNVVDVHINSLRRHCSRCRRDRKSTRLNSSHLVISYAVFCLKKKKKNKH